MRRPLNRILKKFGYEIVKRSRFYDLLEKMRREREHFTFVQVGANDGVRFDNLYFFVTEKKCRGLVIEPLRDYFERLVVNYQDYLDIKPIRVALHPTLDKCTLHRVDPARAHELPHWAAGIASFLPGHHTLSETPSEYMIQEEVPCIPLMKLLQVENITGLDLLQIDTEGFDAEILKMLDFSVIAPRAIKYEHVGLSREDRQDAEQRLRQQGYKIFHEGGDTIAYKE